MSDRTMSDKSRVTDFSPHNSVMEGGSGEPNTVGTSRQCSKLLELAASDDLAGFIHQVEEKGSNIDEASFWYGARISLKEMGFEERTPLMIAAMFGSTAVLNYIISNGSANVNRACGSEGVTALHCAVAGGSKSMVEIVQLLLGASADANSVDVNGNKPADLIGPRVGTSDLRRETLEMLLRGISHEDEEALGPQGLIGR